MKAEVLKKANWLYSEPSIGIMVLRKSPQSRNGLIGKKAHLFVQKTMKGYKKNQLYQCKELLKNRRKRKERRKKRKIINVVNNLYTKIPFLGI